MTIKTYRLNKIKKQYEIVMTELHHLENLNDYKPNIIGKVVDLLQKVKFKTEGRS